jgi:hypothetical protein
MHINLITKMENATSLENKVVTNQTSRYRSDSVYRAKVIAAVKKRYCDLRTPDQLVCRAGNSICYPIERKSSACKLPDITDDTTQDQKAHIKLLRYNRAYKANRKATNMDFAVKLRAYQTEYIRAHRKGPTKNTCEGVKI